MEQEKSFSTTLRRITVIDALRGFALLGVILTHMLQHYSIFSPSVGASEPLFPQIDAVIRWLLQNVIMGRFINIFAFLFGLSFFIQMDSAARKGVDFRKRFLWRMVVLFVIGVVGNCFYTGDILSVYAAFGVIIVFMYRFKNWVLLLLAALLLIGTPRVITTSYKHALRTEQTTTPNRTTTRDNISSSRTGETPPPTPSFFNSAKENLTRGLQGKLNYQFGVFGRGYITFALFLLGLVVGRLRFFENIHLKKRRNIMLLAGFVATTMIMNLIISLFPEAPSIRMFLRGDAIPSSAFAVMALRDINTVLLSGVLAMGFVVLYQTRGIGKYLDVLTPYGRTGLTNYETQGVIGCLLFSSWGFGSIFGSWGPTEVFALGVVVYGIQLVTSKYWLKYYLYGPLEWAWRSATYLKVQPFKKR